MTKKQTEEILASNGGAALQLIAHKKLQSRIKTILGEYELNLTQWLIISRLNQMKQGLRTTDLARFMHVEVPLVTMMTRPLRKRGLIVNGTNTPDRREKLLEATDKASEITRVIDKRMQTQLATMIEGVSPRDMQSYFKVLQSMVGTHA